MSTWQHNDIEFECTANDLLYFIRDCLMYDCCPIANEEYKTDDNYPDAKIVSPEDRYYCYGLTWNLQNLRSLYRTMGTKFSYCYIFKEFDIDINPIDGGVTKQQFGHDIFPEFEAGELQDVFYFENNNKKKYLCGHNCNNLNRRYKVNIFFNVRGYAPPYDLIVMMAQRVLFDFTWYTSSDSCEGGVKYIIKNHNLVGYILDDIYLNYSDDDEDVDYDIDIDSNKSDETINMVKDSFDRWFDMYTPLEHLKALEFNKEQYNRVNHLLKNEDDD